MIKWIWLIALTAKIAAASYEFVPTADIEETRTNAALVRLAHSKPVFNHVGRIFLCNWLTGKWGAGSAVHIEGDICLTCAHCRCPINEDDDEKIRNFSIARTLFNYLTKSESDTEIGFETGNGKYEYYKVKRFIEHPKFKSNNNYDVAVIILDRSVEGLGSLKISNDFSRSEEFTEHQHLLSYVSYGLKPIVNDWLLTNDNKRKAKQAYTELCLVEPENFGLYSRPCGQIKMFGEPRDFEPYEVCFFEKASGGAVFNSKNELVAIYRGIKYAASTFDLAYYYTSFVINVISTIISVFILELPILNMVNKKRGTQAQSTPLAPLKKWIKSVQQQYGEDAHIV